MLKSQRLFDSRQVNFWKHLVLFDVYQGENLGADKQSLALGLTFPEPRARHSK